MKRSPSDLARYCLPAARHITLVLGAALLAGCGSPSGLFGLSQWSVSRRDPPPPVANPAVSYLRARLDGRTAYLVLGYREPSSEGDTEVYYSSQGEVVKLRHGRLVGTAGLPLDWREVRHKGAPAWATLVAAHDAAPPTPVVYSRERDEMPGYRFGVRDEVIVRASEAPAGRAPVPESALRWFEETSRPLSTASMPLPTARYAVLASATGPRVVYSEQCLSPTMCLTLETWPASAAVAAAGPRE